YSAFTNALNSRPRDHSDRDIQAHAAEVTPISAALGPKTGSDRVQPRSPRWRAGTLRAASLRNEENGSVILVELILEVLRRLGVGGRLIVEHVHLAALLVDDGAWRDFLRPFRHGGLMSGGGDLDVGLLKVAGLWIDLQDFALVDLSYCG